MIDKKNIERINELALFSNKPPNVILAEMISSWEKLHCGWPAENCGPVSMSFSTNGFKGGDAGHGGEHTMTLEVITDSSGYRVEIENDEGETELKDVKRIAIHTGGDWELQGFISGAKAILDAIPPIEKENMNLMIKENISEKVDSF